MHSCSSARCLGHNHAIAIAPLGALSPYASHSKQAFVWHSHPRLGHLTLLPHRFCVGMNRYQAEMGGVGPSAPESGGELVSSCIVYRLGFERGNTLEYRSN